MENKQYTIEENDITILSDDEPKNKKCSICFILLDKLKKRLM